MSSSKNPSLISPPRRCSPPTHSAPAIPPARPDRRRSAARPGRSPPRGRAAGRCQGSPPAPGASDCNTWPIGRVFVMESAQKKTMYTWMFNWCNQEMVELAPRKWLLAPNRSQETRWFFLRDRFFGHTAVSHFGASHATNHWNTQNGGTAWPLVPVMESFGRWTWKPEKTSQNATLKKHLWSPFPLGGFIKLQISSQSSRIQRRPAYLSRPRDAAARETWRVTTTWSSATPDPQCARQSGRRWYTASHGNSWEVNVLTSVPGCLGLSHVLGWKIS